MPFQEEQVAQLAEFEKRPRTQLSSASEEQALLEDQKQNVRGEWSSISEENTSAHEDQKEVCKRAMDMEEELKAQYAALEAGQHPVQTHKPSFWSSKGHHP